MVLPRRERMLRVSTSAGRSVVPCSSMAAVRRTASTLSVSPFSISSMSSENRRSAVALSAGAPVMVISLPRTCTSLVRVRSMCRRISSLAPSRFTMIFGSETEILVCTRAAALLGSVPVIGAAVRPQPPALFLVPSVACCLVGGPPWSRAIVSGRRHRRRCHYRRFRPVPGTGSALRYRHAVEGLLDPGEAVGGPVHPDHPAAGVAGQPEQLAGLAAGDRPEHVRLVGQRPEDRRRPVGGRVRGAGLQRAVVPAEDVREALAPPGPEHRLVRLGCGPPR